MVKIYTGDISNNEYEYKGLVNSSVFNSRNMFSDFGAGIKSMMGGKIGAWTQMQTAAMEEAKKEIIEEAEKLGADAIVFARFDTVTLADSLGVVAYGTAVKIK